MGNIHFMGLCAAAISTVALGSAEASRVIYLTEELPGSSAGFRSVLSQEIDRAGFRTDSVDGLHLAQSLADAQGPGVTLVLPNATRFPAEAKGALDGFLRRGNHLIAVSGPAFGEMVVSANGKWLTRDEVKIQAADADNSPILDLGAGDASEWESIPDSPESAPALDTSDSGDPRVPRALHARIGRFGAFNLFRRNVPTGAFPDDHTTTVFWAKGGPNTHELIVEWIEKDRMRWMGVVKLTQEWRRYALTPMDFRPWNDAILPDRGGQEDHVRVSNVDRVGFCLIDGVSSQEKGAAHEFWVSDLRAAADQYAHADFRPPTIESISPAYKTYSIDGGALGTVVSPIARLRGTGSDALRKSRFVPLETVGGEGIGSPRGSLSHLFINTSTEYRGSVWGYLGQSQEALEKDPEGGAKRVVSMLEAIRRGVFIANAGSGSFAYETGESARLGAYLINLSETPQDVSVDLRAARNGKAAMESRTDVRIPARNIDSPLFVDSGSKSLSVGEYEASAELRIGGARIDSVSHRFQVLDPKPLRREDAVLLEDGDFALNGKKWYPVGINYWPSYAVAYEDAEDWLYWLSPASYDPDVVERDLALAEKLKMNVLSVAYYRIDQARPLMDFLARADRHGIKAHVYLTTTHPLSYNLKDAEAMIRAARLYESPAVFSYDLGWEVHVGNYAARSTFDKYWEQWVIDRYGSIESAEADWGFRPERVNGVITGPRDEQLTNDGEWRVYVAAYRRFWDDHISKGYQTVRRMIRSIDPYHLMGARSGWAGTGSLWAVPGFPFDLASGAKHLDYTSPEAYNVSGDRIGFLKGGLNTAYGRFVSGGKPVFWAEFAPAIAVGLSPWSFAGYTPQMLADQGDYYKNMIRMTYETHASGSAGWWWPGGYRLGENSDLGVINPDGSPRPSALEIAKSAEWFHKPRAVPAPDVFLKYDRDQFVTGYAGFYEGRCAEYAALAAEGRVVGVETSGTGTDSVTTPLVAVGNTPCNGHNPPKYLNAEFNWVKVNGSPVECGATVRIAKGAPVTIEASVGNTAEAVWRAPGSVEEGAVYLVAEYGALKRMAPIQFDTPFLGDTPAAGLTLRGVESQTPVSLRMTARGRADFGEVFRITLVPAE